MDLPLEARLCQSEFSACFIGNGSLLLHCAQLWMEQGWKVSVVASDDPSIQSWARGEGIHVAPMGRDFADEVASYSFDYLFSVANLQLLPAKLLTAPGKAAINYHDALLPRYAGIHATSWAILNHESMHGVTWHLMDVKADTGAVVESKSFPIAPHDTAATLNLKCFEAGIVTFAELIRDLSGDGLQFHPQDLRLRTYYGKFKRPEDAGIIRWTDPARHIYASFRAHDLGQTPNSFGSLKLVAGGQCFLPKELRVLPSRSDLPPGTVVKMDSSGIQVSTGTEDIWIGRVQSIEGQELTFPRFLERANSDEGTRFPDLSTAIVERYAKLWELACRDDEKWAQELAIMPIAAPYQLAAESVGCTGRVSRHTYDAPDGLRLGVESSPAMVVMSLCLAFFRRIHGPGSVRVDCQCISFSEMVRGMEDAYSPRFPLRIPELESATTLSAFGAEVDESMAKATLRGPVARDIFARHPSLAALIPDQEKVLGLVKVEFVESIVGSTILSDGHFRVMIEQRSGAMQWSVDDGIINEAGMRRLVEQYEIFLQGIAKDPARDLRTAPILSESEWQQVIIAPNQTHRRYPTAKTFGQLFTLKAKEYGDKVAARCGTDELSYAELDQRTDQLARYLRIQGIRKGDRVGIFLDRSLDMIVSLLSVMKSGAVYVPLDPIYPDRRLEWMIEDSGMTCILTATGLMAKIPSEGIMQLAVDSAWQEIADEAETNCLEPMVEEHAGPEDLAYIIYTSGSTGRPKGVQIPHRALMNFLWSMAETPGMDASGHFAAITTICFDISGLELYLPLLVGATLEIVPTDICRDGLRLKELLERSPVTVMQATPATWQMLIGAEWNGNPNLKILCGGEPLSSNLAKELLQRCKELWNLFGPTETTIWSSCCRIIDPERISIGEPIANTQFYVLDAYQNPVPRGLPGELYIGGDGVGKGYHGRSDLTDARFVPNPFHPQTQDKIYRTGDLVRYLEDGSLQYICRIDAQVKLRGYRVELGEIEAALEMESGVAQALALLAEEEGAAKRIIAYVVLRSGADGIAGELMDKLKAQLPSYMVPAAIVPLKSMPVLPNGKVDRNALPKPRLAMAGQAIASDSSYESQIAQIWRSILQLDGVGLQENFFDAGGDSISLTRLMVELGRQFDRRFPVTTLFEFPTIQAFANFLRSQNGKAEPERASQNDKRNALRQQVMASTQRRRT